MRNFSLPSIDVRIKKLVAFSSVCVAQSSMTYDCSLDGEQKSGPVNIAHGLQSWALTPSQLNQQLFISFFYSVARSRPYVLEKWDEEMPRLLLFVIDSKEVFLSLLSVFSSHTSQLARDGVSFLISRARQEIFSLLKILFIAMSIFSAVISERFSFVSIFFFISFFHIVYTLSSE